jgi:hypothetical protein
VKNSCVKEVREPQVKNLFIALFSRSPMFARTKEILKKARTIWALDHASSLMNWDLEVNMPVEGVQERFSRDTHVYVYPSYHTHGHKGCENNH